MSKLPSDYDVTVSIVLYKTDPTELAEAVRSCLRSLLRVEVVTVDNSPGDDAAALCRSLGAKYIHTGMNLGFGSGHNIGFSNTSQSRYHLILNPDVCFGPDVLEALIAFLDLNTSVGLVMPRVLYPDGSPQNLCKRLPTPMDMLLKWLFTGRLRCMVQRRLSTFEMGNLDMDSILSVPYLSGCFMLLRKEAFLNVGGFDERYFMYFEDLDLTRKLHRLYRTVYYPRKTITHRHERGSHKSMRLLISGVTSAVKYFNKWGWVLDRERRLINNSAGRLEALRLPALTNLKCSGLRRPL